MGRGGYENGMMRVGGGGLGKEVQEWGRRV